MALLWCDSFDHYGTLARLTDGVYAEVNIGCSLQNTGARTGTYCIRQGGNAFNSAVQSNFRRVFGGPKTVVGVAAAFFYAALPTLNNGQRIFQFMDAANLTQISVCLQSTGIIEVFRGDMTTSLGATATPAITANAYQHVECMVLFSQTVGTVEIRVNGVTVLSLSGKDTCATANVESSQIYIGGGFPAGSLTFGQTIFDDLFAWDDTGSYNNTFIGDRRVITLFPDSNTATADWTAVGAASGYECIDEANPNDDTDYISAATVGNVSQFGLQNLPSGISIVSAVVMVERARKTEAGLANTKISLVSGGSSVAGADKPLTEIYTYRQDVFPINPATAAPFTAAEVDALNFKVERTA